MTTRRPARPLQVQPRQPSTGRSSPERVRPRLGPPPDLVHHRPIRQGRGLPWPARLLLVAAVALLGAVILWAGTGQLGRIVAGVGSSLGGLVAQIPAAPTPSPTLIPLLDAPVLISSTPYTNQPSVDLSGTLPTNVTGRAGYRVRIYRSLRKASNPPTLVREQAVGAIPRFSAPAVTLEIGVDFFTATLIGPGGETKHSVATRVVYYATKPAITLSSPQDGATVNTATVVLDGRTRAGTAIVARNEANGASVTGTAGPDDLFSLSIGLEPGANGITLNATDPAGNTGSIVISVLRGTGTLTATLTPSGYRFSAAKLPHRLTLTALVTDPNGQVVAGAQVTFSLSIPGIAPVTQDATTDGAGSAVFATTVPQGATPGNALATILVTTKSYGSVSARAVMAISK